MALLMRQVEAKELDLRMKQEELEIRTRTLDGGENRKLPEAGNKMAQLTNMLKKILARHE